LDSEAVAGAYYRQFNAQVLDLTLVTNAGPDMRGRIFAKPNQLTDADKAWKQALVSLLAPLPGDEMGQSIDRRALAKETELALLAPEEVEKRKKEAADRQAEMMDKMSAAKGGPPNGTNGKPPGPNGGGGNGRMAGAAA